MSTLIASIVWLSLAPASPPEVTAAPQLPPLAYTVPKVTCPPSAEDEERLLALPYREFDQTGTDGWRQYAAWGCHADAARLVAKYIERNKGSPREALLWWHQAQLLALSGDLRGALGALREVKRLDEQRNADAGWRIYVAGTEAFLEGRRADLEKHVAEIAVFADQQGPTETIARLNGNVLTGLLRCFGKPYKVAYGPTCVDREAARTLAPPPEPLPAPKP